MHGDCVEACPEQLVPVDGSHTCRTCEEVSASAPHLDVETQKCIMCPSGRQL